MRRSGWTSGVPAPCAAKRGTAHRTAVPVGFRSAILVTVMVAAAGADPADAGPGAAFQSKVTYCTTCHGTQGRGFRGFYVAPRLAGQNILYLETQLRAMKEHGRDNPLSKKFMAPAVTGVSPAMRTALAKHFSALTVAPIADGPRNLVAAGKKLYSEGAPEANVPACVVCHGPAAEGIKSIPRLAGQFHSYTVAQLVGWKNGLRATDPANGAKPNVMVQTVRTMTDEQISAVAAYLSRLQ